MAIPYERRIDLVSPIRRSPGFFATAVLIVGLGIGMSVAIFSVFRTVLVRRLPVVDQDRIVVMWTYVADPNTEVTLGTKELSVVRRESRTMREVAGIAHWPAASLPFEYGDRSVELDRGMATGNFFDVLGARPALGRLFRPSDDEVAGMPLRGTRAAARALVLTQPRSPRRSSATCARCSRSSRPRSRCCSSSRASTSATCCSCVPQRGRASWPSAAPSVRASPTLSVTCSSKRSRSLPRALRSVCW